MAIFSVNSKKKEHKKNIRTPHLTPFIVSLTQRVTSTLIGSDKDHRGRRACVEGAETGG